MLPTSNRNYGINDTKIHDYNSIDNNYGNKLKSSSINTNSSSQECCSTPLCAGFRALWSEAYTRILESLD